jgi:nuclear transport factor 2 (NTF2) superfamily protein
MNTRPPLPPFTRESAIEKVRLAEDGWNSRDPAKVALAYTLDTQWRNRAEFATNREEAQAFLERKRTGSRCAMPMNGMMIPATGSALTAMKTGSLSRMD